MGIATFDAFKHMYGAQGMVNLDDHDLRLLQLILTSMLKDIDEVCEEQGIDYNLGGGNCIGALRHRGFIPWDDDVDINMTREGYERFVPAFLERFGDKYCVHDLDRKPGYELCFPRIRLNGTLLRCRDDFDEGEDECGIYVDIFLIENTPNNPALRKAHGLVSLGLGLLYSCRRFAQHRAYYQELARDDKKMRRVFGAKIAAGMILSILPLRVWARAWDRWNRLCGNNKSVYVACPVGRNHYFKELWRRDVLYPAQKALYEGIHLRIPRKPDDLLRPLYGDYMQIPADHDRETHLVYGFDPGVAVNIDATVLTGTDAEADVPSTSNV